MAAPSVQEFYSEKHRGTKYGVVDKLHAKGHSGADFNGWAAGTRIPAFAAGTVAAKGNSRTNFGYWVSVDIGGGYFAHYCHEQSAAGGPAIGGRVFVGTDMGPLGSTGYSSGNHLHAMVSRSSNPDRYYGVVDPMPWINAAIAGGGAGGGDDMSVEAEQKIAEIYDVLFNPAYGMKWRQLAQHYWMLGLPLPTDITASGVKITPDSPFRALVAAGPGAPVDVDESELAAEITAAVVPQVVAAISAELATGDDITAATKQLLDAIAGSEKALSALINEVPEETLATFGLKRA